VKRVLLFSALWLVATAATGTVAWGAVRLAGEQTAEQAVRPMTARQVEALAASPSGTTGTTRPATTSTASIGPAAATTVTSATSAGAPTLAARQTRGGMVVVSLQGGRLSLASATPAAGFFVEVEESGPGRLAVVFEGAEGSEIRVRASVEDDEISFAVEDEEDD